MKLKALIVASASVVALTAASSAFAGVAHKRPVAAQRVVALSAPAFSWSGAYAGVNAGYNLTATKYNAPKKDGNSSEEPHPNPAPKGGERTQEQLDKFFPKANGALAGAYAGYNFDMGNDIIAGVETDFAGAFGKGEVEAKEAETGKPETAIVATELKQKWNGATRVRIGYAVDNILPYVAAGVSYAGVQTKVAGQESDKFKDRNLVGFTVGAGVEYAVTQNIAVRGEYRFNSYGAFKTKGALVLDANKESDFKFSNNDIRAGIAYKF